MSRRCLGCMETFDGPYEVCPHCGYVVGSHAEESIHMEPGTRLYDRYIVGKVIGYGGFGATYIGWDERLEQKVAIKEFLPNEFSTRMPGHSKVTILGGDKSEQFHDGMKKFVDEAKRLAKFQNEPGIVKVFDSFEENDTAYIIMEYLEGETLKQYLSKVGTIPEDEAVEMLMPVMKSLKTVHAAGLLHRDIAPDNIFITKDGDVKLIDFGAARYATTSHSRSLTVIVKPGFSPEEQYRSKGDQGPHTDVYSLAATLYKMITGKTPPDSMQRRAKYESEGKDILVPPHKYARGLSPVREVAILNAMNIKVEDRTPDVDTFITELEADTPAKRRYGKIKKIDFYTWPAWVKIALPSMLALIIAFAALLLTGIIKFDREIETEAFVPDGMVEVPSVEGLEVDDAEQAVNASLLIYVVEGSIDSEYLPAGTVFSQTPYAGNITVVNDTVYVVISKGENKIEKGIMPYLIGCTKKEAKDALKEAGLSSPKFKEEYSDSFAKGIVFAQSIDADEEVDSDATITLTVSLGAKNVKVPNVTGKAEAEAIKVLTDAGLKYTVSYEQDDKTEEGKVIRQGEKAGNEVEPGTEILIVVCSGRATVQVKNVVGKTESEATTILKGQGFKVNVLKEYNSTVKSGNVIKQTPASGTQQLPGSTITITVSKGAQPITVNFDATGGKVVGNASKTVYQNSTYGTLPTAEATGFTFLGWYTAKFGGSRIEANTKVTTSSTHTLYAHWSANNYTVSFNAQGGSVNLSSITVTYSKAYNAGGKWPNTPSRQGYSFVGWFTASSGGTQIQPTDKVNTASNHTLYAHWSANAFKLTFDPNGGSVSESYRMVEAGKNYGTLPTPTREYYSFAGWYTAKNGGSKVSSSTIMQNNNVTIYAHWNAIAYTYSIKYVSTNGTYLGSDSETHNAGGTYTISAPSKSGYDTPSSQTITWDSPSKTITFYYPPSAVGFYTHSGELYDVPYSEYEVRIEHRNRTANSIQMRVVWTSKWVGDGKNPYGQQFEATLGGVSTGTVVLCGFNGWGQGQTITGTSSWVTVPLSSTNAQQVSVSIHYYQTNYNGTDLTGWDDIGYVKMNPKVNIPAY